MGYDVLGISQRGVKGNEISMRCSAITGRAPTLPAHSSASLAEIANGCACAHTQGAKAGYMWKDMDTGDEVAVRGVFEESRTHADRCYAAPYWRLTGARNQTYNFLEHVGTQALLYDLELLRSAMGLERLSFYGASYGTGVAASYASTFPERTGRVVLDGNLFPFPNTVSMGLVWTSAVSQVIEHMLNNCRVQSGCALHRPFRSFEAVLDAARRGELRSPKTADGSRIALNNGLIVGYMHDVAEERGCGWKKAVLTLALLNASDAAHREVGVVQVLDRLCKVGQALKR